MSVRSSSSDELDQAQLTPEQKKALALQITSDKTLSFREKERFLKILRTKMENLDYTMTVTVNAPAGVPRRREETPYYRKRAEEAMRLYLFGPGASPNVNIKMGQLRQVSEPTSTPRKAVKKVTKKTPVRKAVPKRLQTPKQAAHMNWS